MNTFKDLYTYLTVNYNKTANIIHFLNDSLDVWKGKDKQESVFRLFAYLKLIPDFNGYQHARHGRLFLNRPHPLSEWI